MLGYGSSFPSTGEWHYAVVTWTGSAYKYYMNGALLPQSDKSYDYPFCQAYTGSLVFGQDQDSLGGSFNSADNLPMEQDAVAIYSRAWTAGERSAIMSLCVEWHRGADRISMPAGRDFYFLGAPHYFSGLPALPAPVSRARDGRFASERPAPSSLPRVSMSAEPSGDRGLDQALLPPREEEECST